MQLNLEHGSSQFDKEYQEFLNENFSTTEYGYSTISGALEQKSTKNVTGMSGSLGNASLKEQGESMRKQSEEIQYYLPQTKEEIEGIEQKVNFKVEELRIKMKQLEYEFKSKVSENQLEILEHMSGLEEVEENTMVLKNQIQEVKNEFFRIKNQIEIPYKQLTRYSIRTKNMAKAVEMVRTTSRALKLVQRLKYQFPEKLIQVAKEDNNNESINEREREQIYIMAGLTIMDILEVIRVNDLEKLDYIHEVIKKEIEPRQKVIEREGIETVKRGTERQKMTEVGNGLQMLFNLGILGDTIREYIEESILNTKRAVTGVINFDEIQNIVQKGRVKHDRRGDRAEDTSEEKKLGDLLWEQYRKMVTRVVTEGRRISTLDKVISRKKGVLKVKEEARDHGDWIGGVQEEMVLFLHELGPEISEHGLVVYWWNYVAGIIEKEINQGKEYAAIWQTMIELCPRLAGHISSEMKSVLGYDVEQIIYYTTLKQLGSDYLNSVNNRVESAAQRCFPPLITLPSNMNIGGGHQMFGGSGALDVDDRALERYFGVMETEIENVRLFEPMMKNVEELIEYSVRLSINNLLDRLKEYDLKENSFLPFQTIDNVIFEVKRNPMFINKGTAIVVGYNKIINLFVELNRKINAKFGTKYKESTERSKNFGLKLYMQSPIMTGGHHSGNVERSGDGLVQLFLGISEEIEMIIVEHLNYLLGSVSSSVIQMMGKLLVISDGKQAQQDKATRNESGKNVTNELSNEFTKNYAMFFSNMEAIYGLIIAELLKKTKVDSEPLSKVVLLFVRVQIKSFLTSVGLAYPLTEDLNLELVDACSQYEFQTTQLFLSLKTTHLNTKGSNKTLVQQSDFTSLTAGLKEFKQLLFLPNDMLAVGSDKSIGGFKNIQNYIVAFHIASRIFTLITNSHSDSPDINTPISTLFGPWSFYDWLENDDSESGDSTNDQNPVFVNVYFPAVVLQDRSLSLPSILPLLLDSPSDSPSLSQTPGSKSMDGVDSFGASSQAQSRRMASKDYLKESAFYNSEKVVYLDEKSDQYHLESSIVRVGLEKNIRNLIGLVDSIDASKIVGIKQCIDLLTNLL